MPFLNNRDLVYLPPNETEFIAPTEEIVCTQAGDLFFSNADVDLRRHPFNPAVFREIEL